MSAVAFPIASIASIKQAPAVELRRAIRSPNDRGATLKRVNTVLALYFDPDNDPAVKAAVRQEFVMALSAYPTWAIQRAFDAWVKTGQRRPTPGEIVILVGRELKPIADELARREREEAERREAEATPSDEELARRREHAKAIMQNVGYAKADRGTGPARPDVTPEDLAEMRAHLQAKGLA
jgi:hypothetical protein